jgi:hypothetical protein
VGINNRAPRAANKRKQDRAARSRANTAWGMYDDAPDPAQGAGRWSERSRDPGVIAETLTDRAFEWGGSRRDAQRFADWLHGPRSTLAPEATVDSLVAMLGSTLREVIRRGWGPSDLTEIVRRERDATCLPTVAWALRTETDRHPPDQVAPQWRDELAALEEAVGTAISAAPGDVAGALTIFALLTWLPPIEPLVTPPGGPPIGTPSGATARGGEHGDHKVLGKVRALLAKAESSEFADEAEALSAKAQELISRYALDRLLDEADTQDNRARSRHGAVTMRRIWIDAPYVRAKASLLQKVAVANTCRTVLLESLGFSTVIGEPADLDAVELLATSLLVQANTAMLRHGRQVAVDGSSRTAAFRRSFLMSYALRIGERLESAREGAVAASGHSGELVPMLAHKDERVQDAFARAFPKLVRRTTSVSDGHGWAAGRAAADRAILDDTQELGEAID